MSDKLELTWVGKETEFKIEPRILLEDAKKSYGEKTTENMLIHGDNLLGLKALENKFTGKVKCIYIDPPYNTGSAFDKYDDNLEHSQWLNLMKPRLECLRKLLAKDGSIWVTLDDNEVFYCKVMMDEIYGRKNFVGSIAWEKADSPKMDPKFFSTSHDLILVYAKDIDCLKINREYSNEIPEHYNKIDDKGNRYYLKPMRVMGGNVSESLYYPMIAPDGTEVYPISAKGQKTCWRWSKKKVEEEIDRIEWVKGKNGWSLYFRIYADTRKGMPIRTVWHHQDAGSNRNSKAEINNLFGNDTFSTPKPEKLLEKVIKAASDEGDWVLDSFLGSATTTAVAHKLKRKWIGIELGNHCYTHCQKRMNLVIDGEQGGVSKSNNWNGGGGYKFYELAPTLIKEDAFGEAIINKEYNPEMLASAVALHEGFKYEPNPEVFWKQSKANENSYLYVTTKHLNKLDINSIKESMKENEFLVIACTSFDEGLDKNNKNIKIKKIPEMLLSKCEFGVDNYDLNIINPPEYDDGGEDDE